MTIEREDYGPLAPSPTAPNDVGEARRQLIDALMHDERPDGSNADEWRLFLSMYLDNRATRPDGLSFVAVQIAEAIEAAPPASPLREKPADAALNRAADGNTYRYHATGLPAGGDALPDPFVLHETVHDGKVIQTVLMPGSGASELVREKAGAAPEGTTPLSDNRVAVLKANFERTLGQPAAPDQETR